MENEDVVAKKPAEETHCAVWQGIQLEIGYIACWMPFVAGDMAFIDVWAVNGQPLPVSKTGYRCRYPDREEVEDAGGPIEYALAWLDDAASNSLWMKAEQLRLPQETAARGRAR